MAGVVFAAVLSLTLFRTALVIDAVSSTRVVARAAERAIASTAPKGEGQGILVASPRVQASSASTPPRVRWPLRSQILATVETFPSISERSP